MPRPSWLTQDDQLKFNLPKPARTHIHYVIKREEENQRGAVHSVYYLPPARNVASVREKMPPREDPADGPTAGSGPSLGRSHDLGRVYPTASAVRRPRKDPSRLSAQESMILYRMKASTAARAVTPRSNAWPPYDDRHQDFSRRRPATPAPPRERGEIVSPARPPTAARIPVPRAHLQPRGMCPSISAPSST